MTLSLAAFSFEKLLPEMPKAIETALGQIVSWLSPLAPVVAGVLLAFSLVWCFLGYRLRRARHCYGMALLGAAAALIVVLFFVPDLSPLWALVIGAGAAVLFGAFGAVFWRVGASLNYTFVIFAVLYVGLGLIFQSLDLLWLPVIALLAAIGCTLRLIWVMNEAEIVFSSLSGLVAAASGAWLLYGLFPAWFDESKQTAVILTVLIVGDVLAVAGIVVQFLTTRNIRPLKEAEEKQLSEAKEAIRAAAAITFDEGIEPVRKEDGAAESETVEEAPAVEPVVESEAEPTAEEAPETEPTAEPEAEPTAEEAPAVEPEAEPAIEPVVEPTAESETVEETPEVEPTAEPETAEEAPTAEPEEESEVEPTAEPETVEEAPVVEPVVVPETAPNGDVKCPACGGWNEPGSRFCSWCGTKL